MDKNIETILVVNDDEDTLDLVRRQLAHVSAIVIPTRSTAEALHILQSMEIAVLICDLNMPEVSGLAILNMARERNPNTVSIVLTAGADQAMIIRAINEGCIWKYVLKPWQADQLVELASRALARYNTFCRQQKRLAELAKEVRAETQRLAAQHDKPKTIRGSSAGLPTGLKERPLLAAPRQAPGGASKKQVMYVAKHIGPAALPGGPPHAPRLVIPSARARKSAAQMLSEAFSSDRYKLLDAIGEGKAGVVFKAEDPLISTTVAIKIYRPDILKDDRSEPLLQEEVRAAMQLANKHIARLHNFQKTDRQTYLVTEYVGGQTFEEVLHIYHKLPPATVIQVMKVCTDALGHAHAHAVVHGDLKPSNLILTEDGVLKITDFGMGHLLALFRDRREFLPAFHYMSPEWFRGAKIDHRADIYAMGLLVYELLSGRRAFPEKTITLKTLAAGPVGLAEIPKNFSSAVQRAISVDPESRWESIDAFFQAMTESMA